MRGIALLVMASMASVHLTSMMAVEKMKHGCCVIAEARTSLSSDCSSAFEKYGALAHGSTRGTSSGWKEKARMRSMSSRSTHAAVSDGATACIICEHVVRAGGACGAAHATAVEMRRRHGFEHARRTALRV